MRREVRDQIVSARLTAAEKAAIEALGGASEVLRRAAASQTMQVVPITTAGIYPSYAGYSRTLTGVGAGVNAVVWSDGTVGTSWPAAATA